MAQINNAQVIGNLGPFNFDRRLDIYERIDNLAYQLEKSPISTVLKKREINVNGKIYILELIDREGNGKPDEFAYLPKDGGQCFTLSSGLTLCPKSMESSQDFGFIFDLNRDGKIDYIVFNGGPSPKKTKK